MMLQNNFIKFLLSLLKKTQNKRKNVDYAINKMMQDLLDELRKNSIDYHDEYILSTNNKATLRKYFNQFKDFQKQKEQDIKKFIKEELSPIMSSVKTFHINNNEFLQQEVALLYLICEMLKDYNFYNKIENSKLDEYIENLKNKYGLKFPQRKNIEKKLKKFIKEMIKKYENW